MQAVHPGWPPQARVHRQLRLRVGNRRRCRVGRLRRRQGSDRGLSKVAALEWGNDNIRVNTVRPFAESDAAKLWKQFAPEDDEAAVRDVPLERIGDSRADVGALVAFLLSDDASLSLHKPFMSTAGPGVSVTQSTVITGKGRANGRERESPPDRQPRRSAPTSAARRFGCSPNAATTADHRGDPAAAGIARARFSACAHQRRIGPGSSASRRRGDRCPARSAPAAHPPTPR